MQLVSVSEGGVSAQLEVHTFGAGSPRIFLTAGIHGNEVTGVYVARRMIEYLSAHPPLRGSVTVLPTVNATAMRCMQRCSPFDDADLNRIFPGAEDGSLSERLAAAVWKETEPADLLVDLHCCGQHGLPYILSLHHESEPVRRLVRRITMAAAVRSQGSDGQLFVEATRRRSQPACIIELPSGAGEGAVNTDVGDRCFSALLDLLRSEGAVSGTAEGEGPVFFGPLLDVETGRPGLWRPAAVRGGHLTEGQVIGTVDGENITAPSGGMAMSVRPCAYLRPGDEWVMTYVRPEE
ncbi:MAG: succinylglutamate desuccinylase/aspartoacylase family protein [Clostridiaceae bacterium]|nr:succinylglutamate desuccinylase/aspartoacylase family protein [Clostridiaceae bacterium]